MMHRLYLIFPLLAIFGVTMACGAGGSAGPSEPADQEIVSTATPVPIPTVPESRPANFPEDDDLRALIIYANEMSPIIISSGEILQRDGEILKQSEADDQVLCDGRLAADNKILSDYLDQVRTINAPADAQAIHSLVIESGEAWKEAMAKINEFCSTGNTLHKIPAAIKFWEAAAKIQDAGNRFWMLMMAEGVEAWVQR